MPVAVQEQACLLEADMLEYMPACKGVRRLAGQGHRLRLAFSSTTGLCLCVYLAVPQRGQFTVLQLVATDNRYSFDHISSLFTTQVNENHLHSVRSFRRSPDTLSLSSGDLGGFCPDLR